MQELSLNILDIVQNAIAAGATLAIITIQEDRPADRLLICIEDNGRGMSPQQTVQARDPFYTTRTTRKVGMGVPLFRMAAEMTGGALSIVSTPGEGTVVTAEFGLSHIDRMPLGNMIETMITLIQLNPQMEFVCRMTADGRKSVLDTRELRGVLNEVPLNEPSVLQWIREYMEEQGFGNDI